MGQQPCCITFVWMLKFNIEQPSIVLNPCLHLLFVSERRLTSLIAYTVITNNILVYVVHLLCNMKINHNLGTLWRISLSLLQTLPARRYVLPCAYHQCRQFLPPWAPPSCFPSSGHCKLWTMPASLEQLSPPFHSTTRFLVSSGGSWSDHNLWWQHPAKDLSSLTKLTQRDLQYHHLHQKRWQQQRFYIESPTELARSSWVPMLPVSDAGENFFRTGGVSGEITHHHVVLFDAFFIGKLEL